MSASFIATWAPWPRRSDGADVLDLLQHMQSRIDVIDDDTIYNYLELADKEIEDYYDDNGTLTTSGRERARQELTATAVELSEAIYSPHSYMAEGTIRGNRFLITGGLSYGDSPSDEFDCLRQAIEAGLLDDET